MCASLIVKPELTRSFIALQFPEEVVKEIARVQDLLSNQHFIGKLTELENLHLTLKFLGELDEEKLSKVKTFLASLHFPSFEAKLGPLGIFHYRGNPHLLWVKLLGKELYMLQENIDTILSPLFPVEERFMGHLTLARIRYVKHKEGFETYLKSIHVKELSFPVTSFSLLRSELTRRGPIYTPLQTYPLEH